MKCTIPVHGVGNVKSPDVVSGFEQAIFFQFQRTHANVIACCGCGSHCAIILIYSNKISDSVHVVNLEGEGRACNGIDDIVDSDYYLSVASNCVASRHNNNVVVYLAPGGSELCTSAFNVVHIGLVLKPSPGITEEIVVLTGEHNPVLVCGSEVSRILEVKHKGGRFAGILGREAEGIRSGTSDSCGKD